MLTIKHVEELGHESIQAARSVSYDPAGGGTLIAFGCEPNGGAVDADGVCRYGDGRVYVMNENGATVGTYNLDAGCNRGARERDKAA
jgi:hypothetical protein